MALKSLPTVPEVQVVMTPAELGAACDIIHAIFQGSGNKRDYNKLVRSLTEVLTSLLAIRGKRLAKGTSLAHIEHRIDLASQEVRFIFKFAHNPEVIKEAFGG